MQQSLTIDLKCRIVFDANQPIDTKQVESHIRNFLSYYSDGRDNFIKECMDRDMKCLARGAIENVIYENMKEKYGNEMVPVSPTCSSSKAIIESIKQNKEIVYVDSSFVGDDNE